MASDQGRPARSQRPSPGVPDAILRLAGPADAVFDCLVCETRLHSTESEADPTGDLCPVCGSLLEPVADLGEIVGYGVIETRGSTSHSRASRAGQRGPANRRARRRDHLARRELKHPLRVRLGLTAATLTLLVRECKPSAFALPRQPLRRDCRASSKLSTCGVVGANGADRGTFALRTGRQATQRRGPV
jgi:hypothetical protein